MLPFVARESDIVNTVGEVDRVESGQAWIKLINRPGASLRFFWYDFVLSFYSPPGQNSILITGWSFVNEFGIIKDKAILRHLMIVAELI